VLVGRSGTDERGRQLRRPLGAAYGRLASHQLIMARPFCRDRFRVPSTSKSNPCYAAQNDIRVRLVLVLIALLSCGRHVRLSCCGAVLLLQYIQFSVGISKRRPTKRGHSKNQKGPLRERRDGKGARPRCAVLAPPVPSAPDRRKGFQVIEGGRK
jgi:hypothetical protein